MRDVVSTLIQCQFAVWVCSFKIEMFGYIINALLSFLSI